MTAALTRYANAGQPIGHAGPDAPVHADPRLDFVADLPRLADSPQAAADGFRATLLQREVDDLRGRLGQLRAAAKRAAGDMERAAVLIESNYLGTGYAQSLHERADELRAAITRSEA